MNSDEKETAPEQSSTTRHITRDTWAAAQDSEKSAAEIHSSILADNFSVLSVATRVRIIMLLKDSPLCVNALSRRLGISAAAVSQHLRILRSAQLVIPDKRGYFVHYHLNRKTMEEWGENADDFFFSA
jgi:DNA-binding transcriptional ArsR family regulator